MPNSTPATYFWTMVLGIYGTKYAATSSALRAITTPRPRSPTSGFSTIGKDKPWRLMNSYTAAASVTVFQTGTCASCERTSDLDSPTKPPDGMPGFAAVNSVSDRCFTARYKMYGTTGMYAIRGGQNSQRVLRRNHPSRRRRVCQLGVSLGTWSAMITTAGPARPAC